MRILFFYMVLICPMFIPHRAHAQITHRDLLQKAIPDQQLTQTLIPQSKFKPFPQTPAEWQKLLPDTVIGKLIVKGELALKKDFKNIPAITMLDFVRNGNRTDYEKLSFEKRDQLWDLVMAESVEGKGRFADQIVNGVWSICEESFWGISAHVGAQKAGTGLPDVEDPIVDLFAAETSAVLAWTDYFAGPQLDKASKLVRPRIRYEIHRRVLNPMLTAKYGWMGNGNPETRLNNWAPWIASNYLAANLLIEQDEQKRETALVTAIKITDQYINGLGVDGGCDEGPSYWTAAGGCVYDVLNLLNDVTAGKLNIYHDPFIQKMGVYIFKTHISGEYFINVADAHPKLKPDGLMIYRFGKDMDYAPMMGFGSWAFHNFTGEDTGYEQFHRTRTLYNYSAIKSCTAYPPKEAGDDANVWYNDVQLMASPSSNGIFVASHAGNNGESHNHNDVGDFMVYVDGYPVIIDVGSGTYTARTFSKNRYSLWFNTSAYHNLPTVNGLQQNDGLQFKATDVGFIETKATAQLNMNIAAAYPAASGLKSLVRQVKLNKNKGVQVDDHYQLNAATSAITQSFMSVCEIDLSTPGKIGFTLPNQRKVFLDYDAAFWDVKKEKMELTSPEDQGLKHTWDGKAIWRILLTGKTPITDKTTSYIIDK